ncbi:stretch-activated Ca2+-permeable channel component-domain-containing protein [Phaeosphaeria sp. MPI-PUGE-AT-0046c]|nr:stretch-activated Ca2+-permeable channel component-domain-containing protein [Phaeosphaeria sp. MPI-PUGE-AT-0046c]
MLLPHFTHAQSRLLPFVIANYLLVACSHVAYAIEVPVASHIPSVSRPVPQAPSVVLAQVQDDGRGNRDEGYTPEFEYFDRSLLGRQDPQEGQTILENNKVEPKDIVPQRNLYFVFKGGQNRLKRAVTTYTEVLEARGSVNLSGESGVEDIHDEQSATDGEENHVEKRQAGNRIWISVNTCRQPNAPTNGTETTKNHPQLTMFVSTSSNNQKPGIDSIEGLVTPPTGVIFDKGFANFSLQATSDIYIGVSAPTLEPGWFGSWHFEIAASTDGPYHSYDGNDPFLYMIDTDGDSALFITYNLSTPGTNDTNKWKENNPFRMYAFEADDVSSITGIERSLCALQNVSRSTNVTSEISITNKFGGALPKSQFHLQGLKAGKKYNGFLTVQGGQDVLQLPGGRTVRGGGMVFRQFEYTTKQDDTCQVIFDLDFCDSVAYAVPSAPEYKDDDNKIKALYDDKAKSYFTNFTNSLAQVACDIAPEAQYSLARTCKDCERDYKNWLCSTIIPRCEDWTATGNFLQERNINALLPDGSLTFGGNVSEAMNNTKRLRLGYNSTRNGDLDVVKPERPYKEMLPCEDLCFDIVRSCPATLKFSCPNSPARELAYGKRDPNNVELRCNFPGAVVQLYIQGAAGTLRVRMGLVVVVAVSIAGLLA